MSSGGPSWNAELGVWEGSRAASDAAFEVPDPLYIFGCKERAELKPVFCLDPLRTWTYSFHLNLLMDWQMGHCAGRPILRTTRASSAA